MIAIAALLLSFSLHVLISAAHQSQASATPPIILPLTFSSSGQYVLGMNISSNQSFGMAISTSTGDVVVAGSRCASCGGVPSFNVSASSTARPLPIGGVKNSTLLHSSVSGDVISESCGLHKSDGSLWSYANQTIIVANQTNISFSSHVSGIFGLGTKGFNGQLSDTVYGKWSALHPNATNFTYGMALNPPGQQSTQAGFLHWSAPDPSAYSGEVSYLATAQSTPSPNSSEWLLQLTEWDFSSSAMSTSNKVGGIAVIDPFYSDIFLPRNLSRQIFTNIPGAVPQPSSESEGWLLPCSTKMAFTVHFGSLKLKVDEKTLVKNVNGTCYSTLVGWADPSIDGYLLGSNFICASYLIFVISFFSPNLIGFASRVPTSSSGLSTGAIVGIAVGSTVFVGILGCLIWLCVRHQKPSDGSSHIRPFILYPLFGRESPLAHSNSDDVDQQIPSGLPSPQFTTHSDTDRPVTVSIQWTTENMAASSNNHASIPATIRPVTLSPLSSPASDDQNFTVEPFEAPPPPYPPLSRPGTADAKK